MCVAHAASGGRADHRRQESLTELFEALKISDNKGSLFAADTL
jgi:hypothetical protein